MSVESYCSKLESGYIKIPVTSLPEVGLTAKVAEARLPIEGSSFGPLLVHQEVGPAQATTS
jgi:hypothetical protein